MEEQKGYNPSTWVPAPDGPDEFDVPAEARPFLHDAPEPTEDFEESEVGRLMQEEQSVDEAPAVADLDTPETDTASVSEAPSRAEVQAEEAGSIDVGVDWPQDMTLSEIVSARSGVEPEPERPLIPPDGPRGPEVELPNPKLDRYRARKEQRQEAQARRIESRQHGTYQSRVEGQRRQKRAEAGREEDAPRPEASNPMPLEMQADFDAANGGQAQGAPSLPAWPSDGGTGQMDALVEVGNKIFEVLKSIEGKLDMEAKWNK